MNLPTTHIIKLLAVSGLASILLSAQPTFAFFATDNFGVAIFQSEGSNGQGIISTTTNSLYRSSTSAQGSDYKTLSNAATGRIGTYVKNPNSTEIPSSGYASASIFDRLTFSTSDSNPVEVTYDFSYKTSVFQSERGVGTSARAQVSIYDVTDQDYWIRFLPADSGGAGIIFVKDTVSSVGYKIHSPFPLTAETFSINLNEIVSGSFIADPNKSYGIVISSYSNATGSSSFSDAFSTSFRFSNLNGATFESSSGTFLSEVNSIPEPSTLFAMLIGLAALASTRYKKTM